MYIKLIATLIAVLGLISLGAGLMHHWDQVKFLQLETKYAEAEKQAALDAAATQKAQDDAAAAVAIKEAESRQKVETVTRTLTSEVDVYVPTDIPCVPYGLVRLLYAAARGIDPSGLPLPAGKSDGACSSVGWRQLASWVIANYGIARANESQLNGLEDAVRAMQAVQPPKR